MTRQDVSQCHNPELRGTPLNRVTLRKVLTLRLLPATSLVCQCGGPSGQEQLPAESLVQCDQGAALMNLQVRRLEPTHCCLALQIRPELSKLSATDQALLPGRDDNLT
jgi:hypothetical protein